MIKIWDSFIFTHWPITTEAPLYCTPQSHTIKFVRQITRVQSTGCEVPCLISCLTTMTTSLFYNLWSNLNLSSNQQDIVLSPPLSPIHNATFNWEAAIFFHYTGPLSIPAHGVPVWLIMLVVVWEIWVTR